MESEADRAGRNDQDTGSNNNEQGLLTGNGLYTSVS